jgi:hypothetical protein
MTSYKLFREIFFTRVVLFEIPFGSRAARIRYDIFRIRILLRVSAPSGSGATTPAEKGIKKIVNLQLLMYESSPVKPYQYIHLHITYAYGTGIISPVFIAALHGNYLPMCSIAFVAAYTENISDIFFRTERAVAAPGWRLERRGVQSLRLDPCRRRRGTPATRYQILHT